jgi:hypothetical protein
MKSAEQQPASKSRKIIPISKLSEQIHYESGTSGTVGTPFSYSHAHAEKKYIPESTFFHAIPIDLEKGVPTVPDVPASSNGITKSAHPAEENIPHQIAPDSTGAQVRTVTQASEGIPPFLFKPPVRSMQYSDPNFQDTPDGSLVVQLFLHEGNVVPFLLYADPQKHCFWDCHIKKHVRPPRFYLLLSENPGFDPMSGFPVVDGAICPF